MICKSCAHESYCDMAQFGGHVPPITGCSKFKKKSATNADRIRAMSDEELAEFLQKKPWGGAWRLQLNPMYAIFTRMP